MVVLDKDSDLVEVTHIEGQPVAGQLRVKLVLHTDLALMMVVEMARGTATPRHRHEHESLCYILNGRVKTTIGDHEIVMGPGDACLHPEGAVHCMEALEDSAWIEVKVPPEVVW